MKKRTKILATLGPASDSQASIEALIMAGVNVFRLNFSHGTHEYHSEVLKRIRIAIEKTGMITGILQDISGPKIRVGMLEEDFLLKEGDTIEFFRDEIVGKKVSESHYQTSINQPSILAQLNSEEKIYLYDGIIRTRVVGHTENGVKVIVENHGKLSSRKGVNFPNTRLGIDVITPKDKKDMLWGIENDIDFMAISFVQTGDDIREARQILIDNLGEENSRIQLFAKIEKFDAIENIDDILEVSDGLMVARGDLGIEVPFHEVPPLQKMLIKKANAASKPVITATQMMLSMTENETATRAEISDVANAVLDGTDVVMLSEESAMGKHPILVVETMTQTIQAAEKHYPFNRFDFDTPKDATDSINESAVRLCEDADCWGMLAMTASGTSARKIARYRPRRDIYAITHHKKAAQLLTISWGIVPAFSIEKSSLGMMMSEVMAQGIERHVLKLDKSYILTAGDPIGISGNTNMIRVLKQREMEFFRDLKEGNKK
jgi:pyruvate kinase